MAKRKKKALARDLASTDSKADKNHIQRLIQIAGSTSGLSQAQRTAAKALSDAGEPPFPHNGCAATLSALLEVSGIDVPMTLGAGRLAYRLGGQINSRGWQHIPVGSQQPGDVGVTFDLGGNPGADHIYLALECRDKDKMLIADNQARAPHPRSASGSDGKTPIDYFLRAPGA
jgi:hypothetical protein